MKERIRLEDALKHIYGCSEENKPSTIDSIAGALSLSREESVALIRTLETQEWVRLTQEGFELTESGRLYALQIIRAHRLYETYLAQETGVEETQWHHEAEIAEHHLSSNEIENLANRLGHPQFDPHGDPIPSKKGEISPLKGQCILECKKGWKGLITHVEDEPESIYAKIVASGIALGQIIKILEIDEHTLKLQSEGRIVEISKQMAMNINVEPVEDKKQLADLEVRRLSELKPNEKASIYKLSASCRGKERQRLLDLGFVPGADVSLELCGPFEDPSAYRIKGTLVALRKNQADQILLEK